MVINHPPDSCEWKWKNLIPPPLHRPPAMAQLWGFRLPLGIYGVRCWGPVHPPPLFQGPGSRVDRPRVGQSRFLPRDREATRCREAPPPNPSPGGPLGSRLKLGPRERGWGKLVISAPASSFHTPSLSLAPPRSLPPAAARCQHHFPFSSFSSLPTPYPPTPRPQADLRLGNAFFSVLYAPL